MAILSKTNKNISVVSVESGELDNVIVTTSDSDGREYEWTVQTVNGVYDYSAGCLLFVDDEEFDYRWQGSDVDEVFQHHLNLVISAANN